MFKKIFAISFLCLFLSLGSASKIKASGWLSGFSDRKSLTLHNSNASPLSNYQQIFTINSGAGSDAGTNLYLNNIGLTSFNDLRFTANDGTTLLPYWIESINGGVATVWVKLDSLPASGNNSFYLYYGNPIATSLSDATNTFFFSEFFDTVNGINSWTGTTYNVNSFGESASQSEDSSTFVTASNSALLSTNASCFLPPYDGAGSYLTKALNLSSGDYQIDYKVRRKVNIFSFDTNGDEFSDILINGTSKASHATSCSGSGCTADSGWLSETVALPATTITTLGLQGYAGDCVHGTVNFDNVKVRTYAAIDLTMASVGNIETPTPATPPSSPVTLAPAPANMPSCTDLKPDHAPDLTQATWNGNSVSLYFVPVINNNSGYMLSYGLTDSAEQNGVSFAWSDTSGMVPYTIHDLDPKQTWWFKVRGNNGCMPGDWSAILKVPAAAASSDSLENEATEPLTEVTSEKSGNSKVLGASVKISPSPTAMPKLEPTASPTVVMSSPEPVQPRQATSQSSNIFSQISNFFKHLFQRR